MCTESPLQGRTVIDPERFEQLALSSTKLSGSGPLYRRVREHLDQMSQRWSDLICEISITGDYEFLAGAAKGSCGRYAIYVDAVVPLQLLITFHRLLAHPLTMNDIGHPPSTFRPYALPILRKPFPRYGDGAVEAPPSLQGIREHALHFLTIRALEFSLMHEIGHIHESHFDYRDTVLGVEKPIRRGFEYLADWFALRVCLGLEGLREQEAQTTRGPLAPYPFRLWGFAIGVWWELLNAFRSESRYSEYYPSPGNRSFFGRGLVATNLSEMPIGQPAIDAVVGGMEEGREAWQQAGWPISDLPTMEAVEEQVQEMAKTQQKLQEFARVTRSK